MRWTITWILFLLIATAGISQQANSGIIELATEGRGHTERGARTRGRCLALLRYARSNINADDFKSYQGRIKSYIIKHWREYWVKDLATLRPFAERRVSFKVQIYGSNLIKDLRHKFWRAREKMAGLEVALGLDKDMPCSSSDSAGVMLDALHASLAPHFTVVTDRHAAQKPLQMESEAFGLSPYRDYRGHAWKEFAQIRVLMYFWVRLEQHGDASYDAVLGAKGIDRLNGQIIFRFRHQLHGYNRNRTVTKVSQEAAEKIVDKIAYYKTAYPEDVYNLKFVNFEKREQRERIQEAILDLKAAENDGYLTGRTGGWSVKF